jgi:subtilisin family serine protease
MVFLLLQAASAEKYVLTIPPSDRAGHISAAHSVTPDDEYFYRQWSFVNDGTYTGGGVFTPKADADIDMVEAWEIEQGDSTVIVAILDTGIKLAHKEFTGRIWINSGEIPDNRKDDDNNGFVDDDMGWDFVNNDNNPDDDANDGHGTSMTGIIGANANNGTGYAGINWNCRLMAVKVANEGGYITSEDVANGILYAVDNGADVISISLIFMDPHSDVEDAVEYAAEKDVVVVCCSGNQGREWIGFPASLASTIAVGASGPDDMRVNDFGDGQGSNWGPELDVVAPGSYIARVGITPGEEYTQMSGGTSEATAFVSGLASLIRSHDPALSAEDCKKIICETADDEIGDPDEDKPGWDKYHGHGRINAHSALVAVDNTGSVTLSRKASPLAQKITFSGKNRLTFHTGSVADMHNMRILTSTGRDVTAMVSPSTAVKNGIEINTERLATGNYFCCFGARNNAVTGRFIIAR